MQLIQVLGDSRERKSRSTFKIKTKMVYKKDLELQKDWVELLYKLKEITGKRPTDLNSILFLVGIQELGKGIKNFSKEEKQDILHIATCKVLSLVGYYKLIGHDKEEWPLWKTVKNFLNLI